MQISRQPLQDPTSDAEMQSHAPEGEPITLLGLSVRSFNALKRAGIRTMEQLFRLTPADLAAIRSLGAVSLRDIQAALERYTQGVEDSQVIGLA